MEIVCSDYAESTAVFHAVLQAPSIGGKGEVFPGPATFGGPAIAQNTEKGVPGGFFLS